MKISLPMRLDLKNTEPVQYYMQPGCKSSGTSNWITPPYNQKHNKTYSGIWAYIHFFQGWKAVFNCLLFKVIETAFAGGLRIYPDYSKWEDKRLLDVKTRFKHNSILYLLLQGTQRKFSLWKKNHKTNISHCIRKL